MSAHQFRHMRPLAHWQLLLQGCGGEVRKAIAAGMLHACCERDSEACRKTESPHASVACALISDGVALRAVMVRT